MTEARRLAPVGTAGSAASAAGSAFSIAASQAASLGAIGMAAAAAAVAYLTSSLWWNSTTDASVAVPVLYAVAVLGAGLCVFLLRVRSRILDDAVVGWVAAAFATAGSAALAQGLVVAELARVPFAPSASGAAALYLVWHAALPLLVVTGLFAPRRTGLRRGLVGGFAIAIGVALWEPSWVPLPQLVDTNDRFTALYAAILWTLIGVTAVAAVLWGWRSGRRPTRVQAWVLVALVLALLDMLVASGATRYFQAIWWSSAALRAATFAAPAVGLLAEAGRLLYLLHQHERGLVDRLRHEIELATATLRPATTDPEARRRIEAALRPGSIRIVYQPVYSLATGDLAAVEALARFDLEPMRTPDRWFTEAHVVGLGTQLELAAVDAALRGAAELLPSVPLTINVAPDVLVRPEFAELIAGHRARQLVVEVTEHAAVDDYQELTAVVAQLRERGVRLAIDDAGAGFASMRHIVRLVPDIIKLDMSLTRDIHLDPVRRSLAASLVGFADQVGASIVAEGVEHLAELLTWQELGAHAAQGYLLGRPGSLPVAQHADVVPAPVVPVAHPADGSSERG